MGAIEDLCNEIFEGKRIPFRYDMESWVRNSRRFRTFTEQNRVKIKAKVKKAQNEAGMQDVRAEIETASVLLREDKFSLEYERYAALKQRGPDFTVTYKTHTPFNVEVRRIRTSEADGDDAARIAKLMAVLCDKVGQMPPSIMNLLWLVSEREITDDDLSQAIANLRGLADRKDEDYFRRHGSESAAEFVKLYPRLSGIVVWQGSAVMLWINPQAKHKVTSEIGLAITRLGA